MHRFERSTISGRNLKNFREEVRQDGPKSLFWKAKIGGRDKQWEAEITEQVPDKRIAWESGDRRQAMSVKIGWKLKRRSPKNMPPIGWLNARISSTTEEK